MSTQTKYSFGHVLNKFALFIMFVIYDGFFHATYAFHKNAVNVESFLYIEN